MENPYTLEPSQNVIVGAKASQDMAYKALEAFSDESRHLTRSTLQAYAEAWDNPKNITPEEVSAAMSKVETEAKAAYEELNSKFARVMAVKVSSLRDAVYEMAGAGAYGTSERIKAADLAISLVSMDDQAVSHVYRSGVEHGNGPVAFAAALELKRRGARPLDRPGQGGETTHRPFNIVRQLEPWRAEAIDALYKIDDYIASVAPRMPMSAARAYEQFGLTRQTRNSKEFGDKVKAEILDRQARAIIGNR